MAIIYIQDLKLRALIGTHPWERKNKQDIVANITIEYDATRASQSDRLKDALDYEALVKRITQMVEKSKDYLLEKLAARILDLLKKDRQIQGARVCLDKPHAIAEAKSVGLELQFHREES